MRSRIRTFGCDRQNASASLLLSINTSHLALFQQGNALAAQSRFLEAADAFGSAAALSPALVEAQSNLGVALECLGRLDEAEAALRRAIVSRPDFFDAHFNLARVLVARGVLAEALDATQYAAQRQPSHSDLWLELGNLQLQLHAPAAAEHSYRRALAQGTTQPALARCNLGVALRHEGRLEEAVTCFRDAADADPTLVVAHSNLGSMREELSQPEAAIRAHAKALELEPLNSDRHFHLGNALFARGRLSDSSAAYRQALALNPQHARASANLARNLTAMRHPREAAEEYERSLAIDPNRRVLSGLLMALQYRADLTPEQIFRQHLRFQQLARLHAPPSEPHCRDSTPRRRIRIGYVSPDFRRHSVSLFVAHVLEAHDRNEVEIFCYSDVRQPDGVTRRIQATADCWRSICNLGDAELAEAIRRDQIDILVDLAGHSADNRLLVFAAKPAPVQVTWLGYPDTTGLAEIDYRITYAGTDTVGLSDRLHTEQLVRLPYGYSAYEPPLEAPQVTPPPAIAAGYVTFGSFNNASKITQDVVTAWAAIMRAVPDARLIMRAGELGDELVRNDLIQEFGARGVVAGRLEVGGAVAGIGDRMAEYARADVALDPFPFNGATMTCEVLWMGVPVVALAGQRHASRVGASILTHAGLTELLAATVGEYVDIAVRLARETDRLERLRSSMREVMRCCSLVDGRSMARDLEKAYRDMWSAWGGQTAPA